MLLDLLSSLGIATPPPAGLVGPVFTQTRKRRYYDRGALRVRVTILGRGRFTAGGQHLTTVTVTGAASRAQARGNSHVRTAGTVRPQGTSGSLRSSATVRRLVRPTDHHHLAMPLLVLDLLTESWDS